MNNEEFAKLSIATVDGEEFFIESIYDGAVNMQIDLHDGSVLTHHLDGNWSRCGDVVEVELR